jgi:hypothetical protein
MIMGMRIIYFNLRKVTTAEAQSFLAIESSFLAPTMNELERNIKALR